MLGVMQAGLYCPLLSLGQCSKAFCDRTWCMCPVPHTQIQSTRSLTRCSIRVQSSCSLQHVPIDKERETKLPADLMPKLAFAVQKLAEMKAVATGAAKASTLCVAQMKSPLPLQQNRSSLSNHYRLCKTALYLCTALAHICRIMREEIKCAYSVGHVSVKSQHSGMCRKCD